MLVVDALERVSHAEILPKAKGARVIGIDVPLGWPAAFQDAMRTHRADDPARLSSKFPARLSDERVAKELGLTPLSVAADLIGRCAWQAVTILAAAKAEYRVNPVEQQVSEPCVIEVYPKAALRVLAGKQLFSDLKRYKSGDRQREFRERICAEVLEGRIDFAPYKEKMLDRHDALDAVLALFTAAAFARGSVVFPEESAREQAAQEGWIYYPLNE